MSVVVIGSSGGGTATLGHTNAQDLLSTIHAELRRITSSASSSCSSSSSKESIVRHGVRYALFISCTVSMDSVDPERDLATLWTVGIDNDTNQNTNQVSTSTAHSTSSDLFQVNRYCTGILKDVNERAKELGETFIAPAILNKQCSGIICISCDPKHVNYSILSAASKSGVPITGSGGTSLSSAMTIHKGLSLVGNAGGSVATTTYTRAVSYCYALSTAWEHDYSYGPQGDDHDDGSSTPIATNKPRMGSILDACLPSFLAVCITCRLTKLPILKDMMMSTQFVSQLQYQALPTVCAVVTTTSLSPEHGSTAVMASVVASMACYGSILAGLLTGWIVSFLLGRTLFMCIKYGVPATMTNILVAGFVGSFVAVIFCSSGIVNLLSMFTDMIRTLVRNAPSLIIPWWNDGKGFGFLFGCIFTYGSKVGWYHSIFLPVILIEMERGEGSLWGSIDECVLVLVSAGICAANILLSKPSNNKEEGDDDDDDVYDECTALPKRGLRINLLCGDFIEVAYPYMEQSWIVNFSSYLASGVATEILYQSTDTRHVLSSAYLPLPLSVLLAEDQYRIILAMLSAFMVSFLGMTMSIVHERFLFQRPTDIKDTKEE